MRLLILLLLAVIASARYVEVGREKRNIEYHEWLNSEQKAELKALHESADQAALKKRTMELYELLPADEKTKWNAKYKEMCVAWIKEVATAEETDMYKKWKAEGKVDLIKEQYAKLKGKLTEEKRKDVELWEGECWSLWKDEFPAAPRGRRSVMDLAEEKLAFLGKEKIAELKALKESGASDDVIRDKVVSWTLEHWKSKDSTASTADFVKKCYGWIKDVTSATEYEEFEKLHHTDHEACRVKVKEFVTRLPADKKEQVEKSLPLCDAIWYKQHQEEHGGHDHHAHKHHRKRHLNTMHIKKFMYWLTPEQKTEIEKLEAGGEPFAKLVSQMKVYYEALESEKKADVREEFKGLCSEWVRKHTTQSEWYDLLEYIQNGDKEGLIEGLKEPYSQLSEEEKHEVDHTKELCIAVWTTPEDRKRRDHHHDHEEYKEYFTWLTPEQGAEVKALRDAGNHEAVYGKMEEYYAALSGDKKAEATEKLKGSCKHFFTKALGADAVAELKTMKESGSSMDDIAKKVEGLINTITDEKKKAFATRASVNCKKIFSASRKRRDHHHDHEEYKEYFTWLTPEQGAEVKALRDAGKHEAVYGKMEEYYAALTGDKKAEATEKLKGSCKHYFTKVFGAEAVAEIKTMKESGSSMDDIAKKVEGLINTITDEQKKAFATKASVNCKKIFSSSRKRRDHHHDHEEYKEYFTWLTPEQGAEVKALRDAGNHEAVYGKMEEYYAALSGDKKAEATEKLKGSCKHFFTKALGADAVAEIKTMKESGSPMDDIAKKVEGLINTITDEKKKAFATRASVNCKKIFSASRKRRDHHHDGEEYKEYFTWLTPEQGAEIKALREAGNHDAIYEKVDGYYASLSGDKKNEATDKLKGACKHFFKSVFGDDAVQEIKTLKEAGTPMEEIAKKVEGFISKITDEKKKATATRASVNCKKIFGVSRKRRDHHKHTFEEGVTEFLPWLTDAQKAEIKSLKDSGADEKIGEKIMEFFDTVEASKKAEATTKLQAGCKHFISGYIGEAAATEMKALKESGASDADMTKKLEEIVGKMPDGENKKKAIEMTKNCKRVFGVASRKRRDHHKHTLEESFDKFLPWITEEQKMELKNMKEAGASDKIGEKILEYFENVDASKKAEATSKLQAGCKHFIGSLIGEAAATEMKALKESGTSNVDMAKKLDEIIEKMADGADKKRAAGMSKGCKKVFGVASRKRRDHHHEHNLEEAFTEFLPWITEEQKMELKNMKEAGAQDKISEKVMEYYNTVDESKKGEATTKLQAGCRHFLKHLLGDDVAGEMKTMHEAGSSPVEMAKKLDEIISKMEDGEKKTKALGLSKNCRTVYGVAARKRRNLYGEYDERYHQYYNWLSEEQKEELEELKDSGKSEELLAAVSQYFKDLDEAKKDDARGQLKMGCRMRMRDLLGAEKAEEIRQMKDEGASRGAMMDKVAQFVETMEEGTEKESARRSYRHCAQILSRQRRSNGKGIGEYLSWLKPEQKQELNELMRSDPEAIYGKLFDYLNQLSGQERVEATGHMRGACRHFIATFVGEGQAQKLKQMKETGKQWHDIEATLDGMLSAIEDEKVRSKAKAAITHCKQFWRK